MNGLTKYLVDGVLQDNKIKVIYPGRFQPFAKHHYEVYKRVCEQFGMDNVYIATSDKTKDYISPFTFEEKKTLIEGMYGIKNIVKVKNPYSVTEITNTLRDDFNTVIYILGEKDGQRIQTQKADGTLGYLQKYEENKDNLKPLSEHSYFMTIPNIQTDGKVMSASEIRQNLLGGLLERKDIEDMFGTYDKASHKLLSEKFQNLQNRLLDFIGKEDTLDLLKEVTNSNGGNAGAADDGPRFTFGNNKSYKKWGKSEAEKLGWTVIDYVLGKQEVDVSDANEPVEAVSFFPSGVAGETAGANLVDLKGRPAYTQWLKHIKKIALHIGYTFVDNMDADESIEDTKNEPTKQPKVPTNLDEDIKLPVEIGDTVLMGKFKNKPVVVKSIDWNEKGDLLINGKPAMKMRIKKKVDESIINEVGEGSAKPYKFTGRNISKRDAIYHFTTESDTKYKVNIVYDFNDNWEVDTLDVEFSATDKYGDYDFDVNTNKGELYKVMATIITAVKEVIKKHPTVDELQFTPSKNYSNDSRREKLYMAFIKKQFKVKKVGKEGSVIRVLLEGKLNEGPIDQLISNMKSRKIQRQTIKIKDSSKFKRFMKDVEPYIKKQLIRVKQNPIDDTEVWISLGNKSQMNEVGDASARPYTTKKKTTPSGIEYTFTTDSDVKYKLQLYFQDNDKSMYVQFSAKGENIQKKTGEDKFDVNVNRGEMYKVMSTISNAIHKTLKEYPDIKRLVFETDSKREKLYTAFIRSTFKNSKITKKRGDVIFVDLKENLNEQDDFYKTEIDYEYEAPSGEKRKRTITYGSVLAQGEDHPLYNKVQQELEDYKEDKELEEVLKKVSDGWGVFSKKGKKLGTHKTKKKAQAQLAAIEISKKKS